MKAIYRTEDAISINPTLDRDAMWMTIHGTTPAGDRVAYLSLREAKLLADALLFQVEELEKASQ